ncbi:MAG: class I SAM-dependent methyltransferase [Cyanobacteria bacterium P01_D01_bin.1]
MNSSEQLRRVIAQKIQQSEHQRITFAEFMDLALYHPQFGYYATPSSIIGAQGDFVTSPHMGRDFGEVVAEQFVDMWEALSRPERFDLVEMGAGQGLVAGDAIAHIQFNHPDCFSTLNYIIVEKSAALRAEQQKRLSHWNEQGIAVSWTELDAIAPNSITGCAFSNELVDAFPVHWVELHGQKLQEIYVIYSEDEFASQLGKLSTPKLESYFGQLDIDLSHYPDGYRTEVNLAALDWIAQINSKLERGYLLTIDYGYTAQRYYSPARAEGTLQCYYKHSHHSDPFIHVGEQDITAHVDFTALEKQGTKVGLQQLGFTQQGLFLMALGLGDRLNKLSQINSTRSAKPTDIQAIMQRRESLQQLINPMGLGNFGVLIQSKGLTPKEIARPLKGLTIPPLM